MPDATLKHVAKLAGVAPVTVSRVVGGSEDVAAATKEKILAIIRDLDYTPKSMRLTCPGRLKEESTSGSKDGFICANKRLRTECNSYVNLPSPPEGAFIFSPE